MPIHWEERIASLIAAGGLLWCVKISTQSFTALDKLTLPMNAVYITAIGVVSLAACQVAALGRHPAGVNPQSL